MKKLLKISLVLVIMVALSMNLHVFAVEKNKTTSQKTNSTSTTTNETKKNETTTNETKANETTTTNETTPNETATQNESSNTKSSTQVTSVASVKDGELSISDILNILLIATGVVIILLAIAIFIKLK